MNKACFYIMTVDTGFAPNPFHGVCTLAACTPNHCKANLEPGDLIVGCFRSKKVSNYLGAVQNIRLAGTSVGRHNRGDTARQGNRRYRQNHSQDKGFFDVGDQLSWGLTISFPARILNANDHESWHVLW
jgi:hypothetical protein